VRCTFTCRQCGQSSPLDEPELEGVVSCPRCNAAQAFDVSAWEEGLAHAHAVADLAGPSPEGRFPEPGVSIAANNPFAGLGVSHTAAELRLSGMSVEQGVMKTRNLWVEASPGHPLCQRCGSPLEARLAEGELVTRCVGCGEGARYAVDPRIPRLTPGLLGIAADALRADRRDARLDQTSAGMVMSLRCPQCGAGLTVPEGAHGVECTFCKTSCRIPSRTLLALKQGDREPAPFWAWFSGPSAKRRELEAEVRGVDRRGASAAAGADVNASIAAVLGQVGHRSIEPAPKEETPASARLRVAVGVLVPLAVLALVGLVGFWKILGAWAEGRTSHDVPQGVAGP
jgi:Zn finger protein HypA/HybF involved in hydrogenase expression